MAGGDLSEPTLVNNIYWIWNGKLSCPYVQRKHWKESNLC
jgi:hypothetical protein